MKRIPEYQPENFQAIVNVNRTKTKQVFNDFFIETLLVLDEQATLPSLPHRKTVNDFVFVAKGKLEKMVCSDTYTLHNGSFMLLPAYKIRSLIRNTENIEGFYCHFSDQFVSEGSGIKRVKEIYHYAELTNNQVIQLDDEHFQRIEILLKQMLNLYDADKNEGLLRLYLCTILEELIHFVKSQPMPVFSPNETLTQRFRKLITTQVQNTHAIQAYADLLHVSPNHLNKCVKITTGKTASDLIYEALIMEAKVLLSLPQNAIAGIAFSLGFEDISYFSRFFKKHTELSPTDYRKMIGLS